jgi:hypothetical protein
VVFHECFARTFAQPDVQRLKSNGDRPKKLIATDRKRIGLPYSSARTACVLFFESREMLRFAQRSKNFNSASVWKKAGRQENIFVSHMILRHG